MSPDSGATQGLMAAQVALHQAVAAALDIGAHPETDEQDLIARFEELEFEVGTRDPVGADWMRRGLVMLLYAAVRAVQPAFYAAAPTAFGPHDPVRELAQQMPDELGSVVLVARDAPLAQSLWAALGTRHKGGPVANQVLLRAAAALVRHVLARLDQPEARWAWTGQVAAAACVGAVVLQ